MVTNVRELIEYADAIFAKDLAPKGTSRVVIYDRYGSLIEWKLKKQSTVTRSTVEVKINAVAYAPEQAVLLCHHKIDVVESITNATLISNETTVPSILLNDNNQAALTNSNKKPYEAPNRNVGPKYTWLLE